MTIHQFKTTINCINCTRAVSSFLNDLPSIESWDVDTDNPDKILTVRGDSLEKEAIMEAVREAGFEIEWLRSER